MKTRIKITVMLMSMIIGTLTVSAQSARRSSEQKKTTSEQKRTTSTSKTYKKPTQKSSSNVTRQAQRGNAVQSQRTSSSNRGNAVRTTTQRSTSTKRGSAVNSSQRSPKQMASSQRSTSQRMSTTSRYNPKSDYRAPNRTVHVGKTYADPKSGNRQTVHQPGSKHYKETHFTKNSTTHYRHHYYPVKKVRIHTHPTTYRGNYRALYYPRYSEIIWTRSMHRHYTGLYPNYTGWHYSQGYRIQTMSVFDAEYNVGEIARVYGRVYATWYNKETDDLLLFFGGEYPVQAFTMVVPGNVARRYSWRPERYFLGQHISATGLITMFEGKAEMLVKKRSQLNVY